MSSKPDNIRLRPTLPIPAFVKRVFAAFPLYHLPSSPAAAVAFPPVTPAPEVPRLFVVGKEEGGKHFEKKEVGGGDSKKERGRSPSSATGASTTSSRGGPWPSSDQLCLRWQMELLFAGVEFETVWVDEQEVVMGRTAGLGGDGGRLPVLHAPSATTAPVLVSASQLPDYMRSREAQKRLGREQEENERGHREEDEGDGFVSEEARLEAKAWDSLLGTRVRAALLLHSLPDPDAAAASGPVQELPYFTSLLHSHLLSLSQARTLSEISCLSTPKPVSSPGSLFGLVGWFFGSEGEMDRATGGAVDVEEVERKGREGLDAIGRRMEEEGEGAERKWFLGSSRPTSLDAHLFSILHVLLSSEKMQDSPLRDAVNKHPVLKKWTRRVYDERVKGR